MSDALTHKCHFAEVARLRDDLKDIAKLKGRRKTERLQETGWGLASVVDRVNRTALFAY